MEEKIMRQIHGTACKVYNKQIVRCNKALKEEYGFTADPDLPIRKNMLQRLMSMPLEEFFAYCANRSFHNFCVENYIPNSAARILGLGLKFCICDRPAPSDLSDFQFSRLRRDVRTRYLFMGGDGDSTLSASERKIYVRNPDWNPGTANREIECALDRFEDTLRHLVTNRRRQFHANLARYELNQIRLLRSNPDIIILPSDKNLGPAAMDTSRYVRKVLTEHLLNAKQYQLLTAEEATERQMKAAQKMWALIESYAEADSFSERESQYFDRRYKQRESCRVPQFYGTPKVHKEGTPLRPIVSKVNSEMEILSIFLDYQLQRVLHLCKHHVRDSWHLLELLKELGPLPPNARLVTVDAVSMYSNINTDHAIESLTLWLDRHKAELPSGFPTEFILKGTRLVMESNIFQFDDIFCWQKNGTAMGTSLACIYATIYFSYHEETRLCEPSMGHGILLYVRFIDDVFAIQVQQAGSHARLINDFNSFGPPGRRLKWLSSGPQTEVVFLDLSLQIGKDGRVRARTFEKPMNLHLYIPSFSAHSPSVARGLIFGMLRRYWLQNSRTADYQRFAGSFFQHLLDRGYNSDFLDGEFLAAAKKLEQPKIPGSNDAAESLAFLHVQFHPFQIPRKEIQAAFHSTCADTLRTARSDNEDVFERLGVKRLIVAQSRATNLRDRLCRTCLSLPEGKRASDYVNHLQREK